MLSIAAASVLVIAAFQGCTVFVEASNFDSAWASTSWVDAAATYFGRDIWSLNIGSCGYGFVCPNRWSDELASGYDLVAISDQSPLYSGSYTGAQCGRCLEVKCREASVTDSSGDRYERTGLCKSSGSSVKLKITDTCDCNYPKNAASNARWCCGGTPHLDVSQWALEKLVKKVDRYGVFAVSYRPIGCRNTLSNQAAAIPIVKSPHDGDKPQNLNCNTQSTGSKGSSSVNRGRRLQRKMQSIL